MSLLTSFTRPGAPSPLLLTPIPGEICVAGTAASAANNVYWRRLPRVSSAKRLSTGYFFWASGAGNAAMALLTADRSVTTDTEALAAAYAVVASSSPIAASGASTWQACAFTTPYTYAPGVDLWVAFGSDAAMTILRLAANSSATAFGGSGIAKASAYSSGISGPISGSLASSAFMPTLAVS